MNNIQTIPGTSRPRDSGSHTGSSLFVITGVDRTDSRRLICLKKYRACHDCRRRDCRAVLGNGDRCASQHSRAKNSTNDVVELIGGQATYSIVHRSKSPLVFSSQRNRVRGHACPRIDQMCNWHYNFLNEVLRGLVLHFPPTKARAHKLHSRNEQQRVASFPQASLCSSSRRLGFSKRSENDAKRPKKCSIAPEIYFFFTRSW
jgi:hypothetical protein